MPFAPEVYYLWMATRYIGDINHYGFEFQFLSVCLVHQTTTWQSCISRIDMTKLQLLDIDIDCGISRFFLVMMRARSWFFYLLSRI